MNAHFKTIVLNTTKASEIIDVQLIQNLWSGYGQIVRCFLEGGEYDSVVVKHVKFPTQKKHPRGWNSDIGHKRKVESYKVETYWYTHYSNRCDNNSRVPLCLAHEEHNDEVFMVLEDLDSSGFPARLSYVDWSHIEVVLSWLAAFHAKYLRETPKGLWEVGTYWHLATRPEELAILNDEALKSAAPVIDDKLNSCRYQTFVHGDAKLANFCFSEDGERVAAVDFQYIGGGCGMKDVAYFVGSCMNEDECEANETKILDFYFAQLKKELDRNGVDVNVNELEEEWRLMYAWAWTDFYRFLQGWSPGHWKINSYSERVATEIVNEINKTE